MDQPTDIRDTIAKELGLEGVTPEERDILIAQAAEAIMQGVMLNVLEKLDEAARDELTKHIEEVNMTAEAAQKAQDGLSSFLQTKVPDFEDMVRAEAAHFKEVVGTSA